METSNSASIVKKYIQFFISAICIAVIFSLIMVLSWIPAFRERVLSKAFTKAGYGNTIVAFDDWRRAIFSPSGIYYMCRTEFSRIMSDRPVCRSVDARVYDIDMWLFDRKSGGASECKLLDFMKANRPLVLNFGSCS